MPFENDNLGDLAKRDRLDSLLSLFPVASNSHANAAAKLSPEWLTQIADVLAQIETNKPLATIGTRGDKIRQRDATRDVAEDLRSRIQHYLSYALPERDADALMNDYGFTPRQLPSSGGGNPPTPPPPPNPPAPPTPPLA